MRGGCPLATARRKRSGRLAFSRVYLIVRLPAILFTIGFGVASRAGCDVNQAEVIPCPVGGVNIGTALYVMGMEG